MPRSAWSLHAYQLLVPGDQLDMFACREVRAHLLNRQLELGQPADRTLCGGLLPALPQMQPLDKVRLRDKRLCPACRMALEAARQSSKSR